MEDIRISIRLTEDEHKKLKILAIRKNTNIQEIIHKYILKLLEEDQNEKN
ncbi:MAG: hypothetical protein HUJ61_07270 [Bacilli bacterium]|nr:hypothetical protein [Bacilli bacterium]